MREKRRRGIYDGPAKCLLRILMTRRHLAVPAQEQAIAYTRSAPSRTLNDAIGVVTRNLHVGLPTVVQPSQTAATCTPPTELWGMSMDTEGTARGSVPYTAATAVSLARASHLVLDV